MAAPILISKTTETMPNYNSANYFRKSNFGFIYYNYNHFTALWILFGTTRVSWYQKKHSPTHTYRGHQSSVICFLHLI